MGPFGKFIKIAPGKETYAELAELALGNKALDRFLVTNDHDRAIVDSIRKKAGCRTDCGIFIVHESSRFQVPKPPIRGIETVASVLTISDDNVFNCLGKLRLLNRQEFVASLSLHSF